MKSYKLSWSDTEPMKDTIYAEERVNLQRTKNVLMIRREVTHFCRPCFRNNACMSLHLNETAEDVVCTLYQTRLRWTTNVEDNTKSDIYVRGNFVNLGLNFKKMSEILQNR